MAHQLAVIRIVDGRKAPAAITTVGFQVAPAVWVVAGRPDRLRVLAGPNRTLYLADVASAYGIRQIGDEHAHLSAVSQLI